MALNSFFFKVARKYDVTVQVVEWMSSVHLFSSACALFSCIDRGACSWDPSAEQESSSTPTTGKMCKYNHFFLGFGNRRTCIIYFWTLVNPNLFCVEHVLNCYGEINLHSLHLRLERNLSLSQELPEKVAFQLTDFRSENSI